MQLRQPHAVGQWKRSSVHWEPVDLGHTLRGVQSRNGEALKLATNQLLKGFGHSGEFEDYLKELEQEAGLHCQKIPHESQVENEFVRCRPGSPGSAGDTKAMGLVPQAFGC